MVYLIRDKSEQSAVCEQIRLLNCEKGPYEVQIKRKTKRRTTPQNSLMWVYFTALAVETGNDKRDIAEYFGDLYLPKKCVKVGNKEHIVRVSTTTLDTQKFSEYIERIIRDSNEMGYFFPSPASPLFTQFFEQYKDKVA